MSARTSRNAQQRPATEARQSAPARGAPDCPGDADSIEETPQEATLFEEVACVERSEQPGSAAGHGIEPGKDHYVRCSGKLIAVLLASIYPTEFDLEKARRDYERGAGAPVELNCRRSGRGTATESARRDGEGA